MRTQKEKDIIKDLKSALRTDSNSQVKDLLIEWEVVSKKDVLAEIGVQYAMKERPLSEKALDLVLKRGAIAGNEYAFALAEVHMGVCHYFATKLDESFALLQKAQKYITKFLDDWESSHSADLPPPAEWTKLRDFAFSLEAAVLYRKGKYAESIRSLDAAANYQIVLDLQKFSFFSFMKARSLLKLDRREEALEVLYRRHGQEKALNEVAAISSNESMTLPVPNVNAAAKTPSRTPSKRSSSVHLETNPPPGHLGVSRASSKKDESDLSDICEFTMNPVHCCHDLHILLLNSLKSSSDALELYKEVKGDGSGRIEPFKEYIKKVKEEDVGTTLIETWSPQLSELERPK